MTHLMPLPMLLVVVWLCLPAYASGDVVDVSHEERTVAGRDAMRYFVLPARGERAADAASPLLLVLPGGDGSDQFLPFVKRMHKYALPEGFVTVMLVATPAPEARREDAVTWPTAQLLDPKQDFPTEAFIGEVIQEVREAYPIDAERIYVLGWSSGGPAAYAAAMTPDLPVRGAFVAMSVFRPNWLPPLAHARGKRFHLLHSPDDPVCPFRMAEQARRALQERGAEVELARYAGGHGWRGDVWGLVRAGIKSLEARQGVPAVGE